MKTLSYLCLLTFLFSISANGKVTRILYFQKPNKSPDQVFLYANGKFIQKAALKKFDFGQNIQIDSSNDIKLVFSPKRYKKNEELPLDLPSATVKKEWTKFLTVVMENPENKQLALKISCVSVNEKDFGNGDFLFWNLSSKLIDGTFGGQDIHVPPHEIKAQKMAPFIGQYLPVRLNHLKNRKEEGSQFVSQNWRILPDRRTLVFFYQPKGRTSMRFFATQVINF